VEHLSRAGSKTLDHTYHEIGCGFSDLEWMPVFGSCLGSDCGWILRAEVSLLDKRNRDARKLSFAKSSPHTGEGRRNIGAMTSGMLGSVMRDAARKWRL
jgi:hypothetical protein